MALSPSTIAAIAAARARVAAAAEAKKQAQQEKQASSERSDAAAPSAVHAAISAAPADVVHTSAAASTVIPTTQKIEEVEAISVQSAAPSALAFNEQQTAAITAAMQAKSICLIGAAGTGKTTVTQEIITRLQQASHVSPITTPTKYLKAGAPGIVVVGFTNKAVNNIRKRLPAHLQSHCITIHKLLEYAPVIYEEPDENGNIRKTMAFEPTYNAANKLPHISCIISEESSMTGTDLWGQVIAALPSPGLTQTIFLGDLNQIPPIFGPSILGFKLLELQTVELTHVYRQALQSPIISLATAVRLNNTMGGNIDDLSRLPAALSDVIKVDKEEHGKVTIHPWKERVDWETAMLMMKRFLPRMIESGAYNPEDDMILCPFNKSFGTIELNKIIADYLGKKRGSLVHEIRARYELHYFAEGDRVLFDRHDAVITKIETTIGFTGKPVRPASLTMDRWGYDPESDVPPESARTAEEIMNALDALAEADDDSKNLCSHKITVYVPDLDKSEVIDTAGEVNKLLLGYALTVHKSQGSEWERVFLFTHNSHAKGTLLSRELLYTAITRAKKELYIICEGDKKKGSSVYTNTIKRAAERPVITGTTLAEKAEWFKGKAAALGFSTGD